MLKQPHWLYQLTNSQIYSVYGILWDLPWNEWTYVRLTSVDEIYSPHSDYILEVLVSLVVNHFKAVPALVQLKRTRLDLLELSDKMNLLMLSMLISLKWFSITILTSSVRTSVITRLIIQMATNDSSTASSQPTVTEWCLIFWIETHELILSSVY